MLIIYTKKTICYTSHLLCVLLPAGGNNISARWVKLGKQSYRVKSPAILAEVFVLRTRWMLFACQARLQVVPETLSLLLLRHTHHGRNLP